MSQSLNSTVEWKVSAFPVDYNDAVQQMECRAEEVAAGKAPELIWFLEHPHVYTAGSSAKLSDVLSNRCPVIETGRGGQVTYHGPGQRIVYLILDLNRRGKDIRSYVKTLEEWIIQTLIQHNITACRRPDRIGLWVPENSQKDNKIAAIGVRIKKWVTLHGIAINLNPDLSYYNGIVPCGIRDHGVTSLHKLGVTIEMNELDVSLKNTFKAVFVDQEI